MASEHGPIEAEVTSLYNSKPAISSSSLGLNSAKTAATLQSSPPELSSSRPVTATVEHEHEREQSQHHEQSINSLKTQQFNPGFSAPIQEGLPLSKLKGLPGFTPAYSPRPMTGEAAMLDTKRLLDEKRQRQEWNDEQSKKTSLNPGLAAIQSLVGSNAISRVRDAPSATTSLSEGMATAARVLSIPEPMQVDSSHTSQVSPTSISSILSLEGPATTATAITSAASISQTGAGSEQYQSQSPAQVGSKDPATPGLAPPVDESASNKALSYPGLVTPNTPNGESHPSRGMSLPTSGYSQGSPRSPSAKKHKCPYCSTDFTRHHNLKSHLLTHSQEKPYVCSNCQARFRRLHDLKRHTRLHTGERPHQCHRCGRQFARGDALARHNKGQGGCAGRRSSAGSFVGDNDFAEEQSGSRQGSMRGDDGMEGLLYTGEHGPDDGRADAEEEERRRRSLPMIKTQEASGSAPNQNGQSQTAEQGGYQSQYARTYPPAMGHHTTSRAGSLHPPPHHSGVGSPSSTSAENTLSSKAAGSSLSNALTGGPPSVFTQGMTESPKPLSPGGMQAHQIGHSRSTSYSQHLPRLPPVQSATGLNAPQLPPLAHTDPRLGITAQPGGPQPQQVGGQAIQQSQAPSGTSLNSYHQHPGGGLPRTSSFSNNGSSSGQASIESQSNIVPTNQERLWAYVRSLEDRVNRLQAEVDHLKTELGSQARPADGASISAI